MSRPAERLPSSEMPVLSALVRSPLVVWCCCVPVWFGAACRRDQPSPPAATHEIPAGPLGDAIRRGRALLVATPESLPAHVGNRLRCVSCHLDEGRRETGSWVGVYARFPQYRARSGTIETIEYRVNDCFRRSMN